MDLAVGTRVGEYEVTGKLGEGGFGAVYSGVQPDIGKQVAIKVLNPAAAASDEIVHRFKREARAVNEIRHPNIIDIFSFGTLDDGRPYFVMEKLDGASLQELLRARGGRMTVEELLPILAELAEAVDAAHAKGIIHRDLKPDNVFVAELSGGRRQVKVLDFGIAKLSSSSMIKTATGVQMGTPLYMSPEQCFGQSIDSRTDVYAYGVIAYHALTGRYPIEADSMVQVVSRHMMNDRQPPSAVAAPASLDEPLMRCLAGSPAERFATLGEAYAAIERALAPTSRPVPVAPLPAAPPAAHPTPAPAAAAPTARPAEPPPARASETPSLPTAAAPTPGPTTLGSAAAEATSPPAKRTSVWLGAGVVAALAVGGSVYALTRGGGSGDETDVAANEAQSPASDAGAEMAAEGALVDAAVPSVPIVRLENVTTSGDVDPMKHARRLRWRMEALESCYDRALAETPGLGGAATLEVRLEPSGAVANASLEPPLAASLAACVTGVAEERRFVARGERADISFELVFQPDAVLGEPTVTIDRPEVRGSADPDAVLATLEGARDRLVECWAPVLAETPSLIGRGVALLPIRADGTITDPVRVEADSETVSKCLAFGVLESLQFERQAKPSTVLVGLTFGHTAMDALPATELEAYTPSSWRSVRSSSPHARKRAKRVAPPKPRERRTTCPNRAAVGLNTKGCCVGHLFLDDPIPGNRYRSGPSHSVQYKCPDGEVLDDNDCCVPEK